MLGASYRHPRFSVWIRACSIVKVGQLVLSWILISNIIADETPKSLEEQAKKLQDLPIIDPATTTSVPEPKAIFYTDNDDPFSFLRINSKVVHVNKLSRYSWVACGGSVFVLELLTRGYVRIERNGEFLPALF